jgi:hypothetical protein
MNKVKKIKQLSSAVKYIDDIDLEYRQFQESQNLKFQMLQNLSQEKIITDSKIEDEYFNQDTSALSHCQNSIVKAGTYEKLQMALH